MAKPKKSAPSKKSSKKPAKPAPKKTPAKKAPIKKSPPKKKTSAKKTVARKTPAKKAVVKKPVVKTKASNKPVKKISPKKTPKKDVKSTAKKSAAKPAPAKKQTPPAKAAKPVAKKPAPAAPKAKDSPKNVKPVEKKTPAKLETKTPVAPAQSSAKDKLRDAIITRKKVVRPTAFTLDEAREIAKHASKADGEAGETTQVKTAAAPAKPDLEKLAKSIAPTHVKAASLAEILGFNPKKAQKPALFASPDTIPEKYRRYYKLLLDLRASLTEGLSLHTEETLRRSTKDDAGDLSSYGQHMADAGTDTFDRDFALSMVANEQEALTEIDAAIKRIENGTYGICEITQKPIAKERLLAVPFTRYSAEAQKDIERNRMRVRTAAGLFGELGGDDSGRGDDGSGGGDEE